MWDKIEIKDYFAHENKSLHTAMVINTLIKYTDINLIEKIYLYNIFSRDNKGSGKAAILALQEIVEVKNVDFLIMSITLTNELRYEQAKNLCKRITALGTTIIAADSNRVIKEKCYPFSFECVYGISQGAFWKKPFFSVDNLEQRHILGDASPEFICFGKDNYQLFGGTSKAVPKFLSSILNSFPEWKNLGCKGIEEWVKNSSLLKEDNAISEVKDSSLICTYSKATYETLYKYICECPIDIRKYGIITPSFQMGQLGSYNLASVLIYVLNKFNINAKLEDMVYSEFSSLGNLCSYIERLI